MTDAWHAACYRCTSPPAAAVLPAAGTAQSSSITSSLGPHSTNSSELLHGVCRCGADIVAADLRKKDCDGLLQAVESLGRRALFVECDVRDRLSVDDSIKTVEK